MQQYESAIDCLDTASCVFREWLDDESHPLLVSVGLDKIECHMYAIAELSSKLVGPTSIIGKYTGQSPEFETSAALTIAEDRPPSLSLAQGPEKNGPPLSPREARDRKFRARTPSSTPTSSTSVGTRLPQSLPRSRKLIEREFQSLEKQKADLKSAREHCDRMLGLIGEAQIDGVILASVGGIMITRVMRYEVRGIKIDCWLKGLEERMRRAERRMTSERLKMAGSGLLMGGGKVGNGSGKVRVKSKGQGQGEGMGKGGAKLRPKARVVSGSWKGDPSAQGDSGASRTDDDEQCNQEEERRPVSKNNIGKRTREVIRAIVKSGRRETSSSTSSDAAEQELGLR